MRPRELRLAGVRSTFLVVAAILVVSLVVIFVTGNSVLRSSARGMALENVEREIQRTFSTLQDAETGQRGFLISQRDEYLEPYIAAVDEIEGRLRRMDQLVREGLLPADATARFSRLAQGKIAEMARTIEVARGEGFPASFALVREDVGKRAMDEIRTAFGEIQNFVEVRLDEVGTESRRLTQLRTGAFVGCALMNLAFLFWAYRQIRREMARRYVADLEAQRQRDILAVSLASIGDAVILTDIDSRITFLNDVAVELTGWPREEVLGAPCSRIFRIINETTREPVESPVDLVLKTGKIVGLANHTLLIRKDGSEVSIDDSGAPVREPDGEVRGVVLVFRDFSHYKNAEREQAELKQRLEVANHAKDDFIAALSHELRTPLTPVMATLSTWESGRELPDALAADVKMLVRNVQLEVRLIDDLLDLTRIARGQMTLHRETVDAHTLLAAVLEIFRDDLERRDVRVTLRPVAGRSLVNADPVRLQQVFWNILGNAAKATPDGGRIEIVTTNGDGTLHIVFADNGRGMTPETIQGLFRPFERTGRRVYQGGGLGIGLSISQSLIRAHDGDLEAESGGAGLGSTFTVTVPTLPEGTTPGAEPAARGERKSAASPLAILILEDHADSADVIARILRSLGHAVEVSGTVAEGLGAVQARSFDLVLSDIGLPDGTGVDFIARAREFTAAPMIALTGYGMEEDGAKYREAGFLRQLTKPIRFDQIEELVTTFAESAGRKGGLNVRTPPPKTSA